MKVHKKIIEEENSRHNKFAYDSTDRILDLKVIKRKMRS